MFKSKELGISPGDYFYKRIHELKSKLGNVPIPKRSRQNLIEFCRRMEPPTRQQLIPWCTTGEVEKCPGNTLDTFPWTRPPGAKTCRKESKSGLPDLDISTPEFESPPTVTRFVRKSYGAEPKPIIPVPSYRNEKGIMITNIAGIGDLDGDDDGGDEGDHLDDQLVPHMSLEMNPELKKQHSRYRLKKFGMYFVRLERVVDPFDFFMEFIQKPPEDGCKDWSVCLQHFYGDPKVDAQYKLNTMTPLIGQRYAIYNDELETWERVRVKGLSIGSDSAQVAFLDRLAPPLEINFGAFYELDAKFGHWAKYPLKGALKDVRPHNFVEGVDNNRTRFDFSQEAIQYFKEATTKDKIFRAFIIQKSAEKMDYFGYGDEDRFTTCMVYLFEMGKPMIPLNAEMVQKGLLKPIKSMECTLQLMKNLHGLDLQIEHPEQTILNRVENRDLDDEDGAGALL